MVNNKLYTLSEAREYLFSKMVPGLGLHRNIFVEKINGDTDYALTELLVAMADLVDARVQSIVEATDEVIQDIVNKKTSIAKLTDSVPPPRIVSQNNITLDDRGHSGSPLTD